VKPVPEGLHKENNMNKNIMRRIFQVWFILIIQGVILFIAAWTIYWLWAWIFLFLSVVMLMINLMVIPAELIEERGKKKEDVKKWDKIVTSLNIIPTLCIFLFSGLDYRLHWTQELPILFNISGLILLILGSMLFTWAMISNKFFSTMVRLQTDRNHQVATSGPYKLVRHPGYVGYIIMFLAIPLALGSLWSLSFSVIITILLIIRTYLEDKTLKKELKGYTEYSELVKYKLIPFIW
jgi:protein-S-isoprenylcysteine O-methyltransferase Ste14